MDKSKLESSPKASHELKEKEGSWRDYFAIGEVFGYFFRKKDASRPNNFNIRMMHGINKISILIFLAGLIYMILKRVF